MTKTEKVKNYVLRLMEENKSSRDFKLPSQNTLSRILQVSRITVLNALTELSASGRIVSIRGKGIYALPHGTGNTPKYDAKLVAFMLPDLQSMFMQRLLAHAEHFFRQKGYSVILYCSEGDRQKEYDCISLAAKCGAKGVLIYPNDSSTINKTLFNKMLGNMPAVFLDAHCQKTGHVCVRSDSAMDVSFIIGYLHRLGHFNIGCIMTDPRKNEIIFDRFKGYKQGLRGSNLAVHKKSVLILDETSPEGRENQLRDFFKANPRMSAVITFNSHLYTETVYALRSLKKRIPQDISIVTYNDDFFNERLITPSPTVISQRLETIVNTASKKLIAMIGGEIIPPCDIAIASEHLIADTTRSMYAE